MSRSTKSRAVVVIIEFLLLLRFCFTRKRKVQPAKHARILLLERPLSTREARREREREREKRANMNEALNVRFASSSSSSLPLSSHVHFVSNSNAPTAFLFAHALHECAKNIQRNNNTTTTDENEEEKKNARNAIVLCVETRGPFEKLVGPHLKKKNNNNKKAVYESIDCWSKPVDFLFDDDDDDEEEDDSKKKKKKNDEQQRSTPPRITFTVKSANSNSISSLDGLYDLIAERIDEARLRRRRGTLSSSSSSRPSDARKGDESGPGNISGSNSATTTTSVFIDSLDALAARTNEKAVVRFLLRLREMEGVALVTGCARAEEANDGFEATAEDFGEGDAFFVDEDDRERRRMHALVENLADVTLTTSKLPSEGGNKGELVKVITRHRTVDSKYLDWDGSVVNGRGSTLVDEENSNRRRPGVLGGRGRKGVDDDDDNDDDDDELTSSMFSLTTECVATISELGAKCERYSFSV
jgi:hypothetical protein